jgi:hypothetical protein
VAVAVIVDQAQQGLLAGFRRGWYGGLGRRADGLFELTDALLCTPGPVGSLPQLSLEPRFRRGWGSLYGVLAEGDVAAEAVRDLLAAYRPVGWPLVFAVDQTTWPRCDAECSPARACTTTPRGTRRASPSWRAGPTSGSASWAGSTTRGPRRSTPVGSCQRPIRCRRPSGRLVRWSSGSVATRRPRPPRHPAAGV